MFSDKEWTIENWFQLELIGYPQDFGGNVQVLIFQIQNQTIDGWPDPTRATKNWSDLGQKFLTRTHHYLNPNNSHKSCLDRHLSRSKQRQSNYIKDHNKKISNYWTLNCLSETFYYHFIPTKRINFWHNFQQRIFFLNGSLTSRATKKIQLNLLSCVLFKHLDKKTSNYDPRDQFFSDFLSYHTKSVTKFAAISLPFFAPSNRLTTVRPFSVWTIIPLKNLSYRTV